jgi:hypothetical protein
MKGRVAIITGASRGIGRECALTLARAGCAGIVVAAKSVKEDPRLPGTIYTVADEVSQINGCVGFPYQVGGVVFSSFFLFFFFLFFLPSVVLASWMCSTLIMSLAW